jgi:hypothetical protein
MTELENLQALGRMLPPPELAKWLGTLPLYRKTARDLEREICTVKVPEWQKNGSPPDASDTIPKLEPAPELSQITDWIKSLEIQGAGDVLASLETGLGGGAVGDADLRALPLGTAYDVTTSLAPILEKGWATGDVGVPVDPSALVSQIGEAFRTLLSGISSGS